MTSSRPGAGIVKEWEEPTSGSMYQRKRIATFRDKSDDEIEQMFRSAADTNGVERPTGYTVSWHYNAHVENYHFGERHPMKPWRLQLTKQLVLGTGLHYGMDCYQTLPATKEQLELFHSKEYVEFLSKITSQNMHEYISDRNAFAIASDNEAQGSDCPVFDGMWEYCCLYSGATIDAARNLISGQSSIAINWSGGLHHAKKKAASGFCYINDIVLAIIMMLKYKQRVLYIDIDVHHGDGVEQAFWSSDRVMTLSFHKYDPDNFFPGTGGMNDTGPDSLDNPGAHYSLNVPLDDGITDDQYKNLFRDVVGLVMDKYRPEAVVLQCGADSLGGDRLGKFNLNIRAHGDCVAFVKQKCGNGNDIPLLILGGGGYTPRNVARTWTHETAICVGMNWSDDMKIPDHIPYRQAFEGNERGEGRMYPKLDTTKMKHQNSNTAEKLRALRQNIEEQLRFIEAAPSVQLTSLPTNFISVREDVEQKLREAAEDNETNNGTRRTRERNIGHKGELK